MHVAREDLFVCALKLIETVSGPAPIEDALPRYWALAGPLETFAECATTDVEKAMANALRDALDELMRETASRSAQRHARTAKWLVGRRPTRRAD